MIHVDSTTDLRRSFGAFASGVTVVASLIDNQPIGFTLSSFTNVSLEPALVLISPSKKSQSWQRLKELPSIGISILSSRQEKTAVTLSKKNIDRFAEISYRTLPNGAVIIEGASAWFEAKVVEEVSAGDHLVVILEVLSHGRDHSKEPLIHHSGIFKNLEVPLDADEELAV